MGKIGGFLEIAREVPSRRPVKERLHDWREYEHKMPEDKLRAQGARCMDCGIPFCHKGCPLGNIIPDWNDLVYRGRFKDAIARLHMTNNFPEFTGRVCPAPCEEACVLNINSQPVTIKLIEKNIIDHAFAEGWVTPVIASARTGKKVAVVGSGPSGSGLRAATRARRARRHPVRTLRPGRRPADVRDSRLQAGEMDRQPAPGADGGRGGRVQDQLPRRGGLPGGPAPRSVRRDLPDDRFDQAARSAGAGARAQGDPLCDGLSAPAEQESTPAT